MYYHSLLGIKRGEIDVPAELDNANLIFLSFRMPLFFILSGIFISKSLAKNGLGNSIWKKFELLVYPYLIWSVMQITLQIIFSRYTNSNRTWEDYTYIFYQPRGLDQFWYLPALFNCTIIYILIKEKMRPNLWAHAGFALLLYFASPYFQAISMISDFMRFYIFLAIGDMISAFFFKPSSQRFFIRRLSFLLILPLFVCVQIYYLKYDISGASLTTDVTVIRENWLKYASNLFAFLVIAMIGCLTMVKLSFLLQRFRIFPFLRVIGYHSLYIYVMHLTITGFTRIALVRFLHIDNPFVLLGLSIAMGTLIPIAVYNLLIRKGPLFFLFSFHKDGTAEDRARVPKPTPDLVTVGKTGLGASSFVESQTLNRNPTKEN